MNVIKIESTADLQRAASEFLRETGGVSLFAFYGPMGVGKTTFISAICTCLGVQGEVSSPTFTIVNEYRDRQDNPVYHFDFYRIESPAEAMDIGVEEYFASGDICLMEWPERVEMILPEDVLKVYMQEEADGSRTLSFKL